MSQAIVGEDRYVRCERRECQAEPGEGDSGLGFPSVVADADAAWNKELAKVNIETSDSTSRRIFYTAMYHTMTAPSVFSDVNGQYRGADGKVYDGNFTNYTTLSLWDTYRAAHPLMTMIHTDMLPDMASTFINIYRQQGKLPVWHLMGNRNQLYGGHAGIPVLADMVLKGYVKDKERSLRGDEEVGYAR